MTLIKHEPLAAEPAFSPEDSYQQHHQQCTENEIFLTLQALYPSVSPERLLPWLEECILQSSQLRTGEGGARRYEVRWRDKDLRQARSRGWQNSWF
ncbi:uncharacterized protein L3040_005374 [Drepanopeziza brunnea f. sp. 'multigermtubi']|uniref:uncharacterized protein n=1 Tax=Drepanopeziza brunnea f. sp. 'multigermtubi' TaxID=698441 RepID=UPI00239796C3|nr:hypothetical protein L3040_005374 [Drepanopeziza brunnea f. sp. 'multigermtubi']